MVPVRLAVTKFCGSLEFLVFQMSSYRLMGKVFDITITIN